MIVIALSVAFLATAGVVLLPQAAAEETENQTPYGNRPEKLDLDNAYNPAQVYVTAFDTSLQGTKLTGSVTVENRDDEAITDLSYRIELYGYLPSAPIDGDPQTLFWQSEAMPVAALLSGESVTADLAMTVPSLPLGSYVVQAQVLQTGGRKLGWGRSEVVVEKAQPGFVFLGEEGMIIDAYGAEVLGALTGPNTDPSTALTLRARATVLGTSRTVVPEVTFYRFDPSRGAIASVRLPAVRLAANEETLLDLPVTAPAVPGTYMAVVTLHDGKNTVSSLAQFRMVVRGMAADLLSARLATVATKAGETAFARIDYVGSADAVTRGTGQLQVELRDSAGVAGRVFVPAIRMTDGVGQGTARIVLARDLGADPALHITIRDDQGRLLTDASVPVALSQEQVAASAAVSTAGLWMRWYLRGYYLLRIAFALLGIAAVVLALLLWKNRAALDLFARRGAAALFVLGLLLPTVPFTYAFGGSNGIQVFAPITVAANAAAVSNPAAYQAYWSQIYPQPIVALFVNQPIHNSSVQCQQPIPLQLRVDYAACNNIPAGGRIIVRFDQTGQLQSTLMGVAANWIKIFDQLYVQSPSCPGGALACIHSTTVNTTVNLTGLPLTALQTTLQVVVKHNAYIDATHPLPDDVISLSDIYFVRGFAQAFNLWLNCIPPPPDLSIIKTSPGTINQGDNANYSLNVTNVGQGNAANVVVTDPIPAGLFFSTTGSDSRCSQSGNNVVCSLGTMTPSQTIILPLRFTTNVTTACGVIPNAASVATTTTEPNQANNQSTVNMTVICPTPTVDIQVVKTTTTPIVQQGNTATFNLTVTNNGPSTAQNVTLTDPVPAGLTYIGPSDPRCTQSAGTITCALGTLLSGQSISPPLQFVYQTSASTSCTTIPNVASVTTTTSETNLANNQSTASITVQCPTPTVDVQVTKTTVSSPIQQGNQASFTLAIRNNGPASAQNVTLTDPIPTGLTFVSSSDNRCGQVGSSVNCTFGTMTSGQQINMTFTYQTSVSTQCTTIPNVATVATTTSETNLTNNQSTANVVVQCPVVTDIEVVKTAVVNVLPQGNQASFTLLIRNNGPSSAQNVTLTDPIPTGLTFVSSSDNRCGQVGSSVNCTFGTMTSGQQINVTFTYQTSAATQCTTIPNIATVATSTQETNMANNQSTASVTISCPTGTDIQVTKTTVSSPIQQGNQASFTLLIRNNGPDSAQNVTLTDAIPTGLTFVSSSDNRCGQVGSSVNCTFGTMTSGQQINVTFTYQTSVSTQCTTIQNVAIVATSTAETNTANNQSTAFVTVLCPQLGCIDVIKETFDSNGNPITPIPFTFTLNGSQTVQNGTDGRAKFLNVAPGTYTVTETLPAGWTQQLVTPAGGVVTVQGGQSCSTVVFKNRQVAPPVQTGCIEVTKTTRDAQGNVLSPTAQFTFTLDGSQTAQNDSTGKARFLNVSAGTHTVGEQLPAGWTQTQISPSNGVVTVQASANNISCAQVSITNQQNPVVTVMDLSVVKTGQATVQRGSNVSYQLLVLNAGPAAASSVQVVDAIPAELTFLQSGSDSRCAQQGSAVVCQLGTMQSNQQISLQLTFSTVAPSSSSSCAPATVTNVVTVGSSTADASYANNTASVSTTLTCPAGSSSSSSSSSSVGRCERISIDVDGDPDPVRIGEEIEYRIRIENDSNVDQSLDIIAELDDDMDFEDASDGGDEDNDEVEWEDIDVDARDDETITLTVSVRSSARDGDRLRLRVETDCDDTEETVRVIGNQPSAQARLTIDKSVDRSEAQPGDVVTYNVTVRNLGSQTVRGVSIDDVYTAGQLSILDPAGGQLSGTSLRWLLDRVDANTSRSFRYTARMGASMRHGDVVTNTVTLTAPGQYATDSALVRIITSLPQTGIGTDRGWKLEADNTQLRPVSGDASSDDAPIAAATSVVVTVLLAGIGAGGAIGRKFFF